MAIASWVSTATSGTTRNRMGWMTPADARVLGEPCQLVGVVDDHAADPLAQRQGELLVALGVAVELDPVRRRART